MSQKENLSKILGWDFQFLGLLGNKKVEGCKSIKPIVNLMNKHYGEVTLGKD